MRIFSRTALPRSTALPLQVFVCGVALVLLVLTLVFVLLSRWVQRNADTVVQRELEQSADLVAQVLSGRQRSLAGGARVRFPFPSTTATSVAAVGSRLISRSATAFGIGVGGVGTRRGVARCTNAVHEH